MARGEEAPSSRADGEIVSREIHATAAIPEHQPELPALLVLFSEVVDQMLVDAVEHVFACNGE